MQKQLLELPVNQRWLLVLTRLQYVNFQLRSIISPRFFYRRSGFKQMRGGYPLHVDKSFVAVHGDFARSI